MVLNCHHDSLHRHLHAPCRGLDDADIGLMRHDPVHILAAHPDLGERGFSGFGQFFHCVAEDFLARHVQMPRCPGRGAAIDVKQVLEAAIGMQIGRQDAPVGIGASAVLRFQHQRARAVAEQNAGAAVFPVHQLGKGLGADDQHAAGLTCDHQRIGGGQGIDKSGADRLHVEGKTGRHAKLGLHHRCRRGKGEIGGRGRNDHRIDIDGIHAGIAQRRAGRGGRHVRGRLAFGREMPPFDARAGADPFVGRIDDLFKFAIGHDA